MEKKKIVDQTKLAFDLIQKLYQEVAYLIREIEGQLAEEDENFVIGKPSGYSINSRNSTGLEQNNVMKWPIRKLNVFFVPEDLTEVAGITNTYFTDDTKVILIRIILDNDDIAEPEVHFGVLYDFGDNPRLGKRHTKVEQVVSHIEYRENTVFQNLKNIDYDHVQVKFRGVMKKVNLFDINNSEDVNNMIVQPALKMFRELK